MAKLASMPNPWSRAFAVWVESIDGQSKEARAAIMLGVSPGSVHRWLKGGLPKMSQIIAIEAATAGAVPSALALQQAKGA